MNLLYIYIYIYMLLSFHTINSNIGHFLHQELQYLLDIIFKNPNEEHVLLLHPSISTSLTYRWHYSILNILSIKHPKFKLKLDDTNIENQKIYPGNPKIIDIEYIKYLQKIVFDYYNIDYNIEFPEYKVLYTRIEDTDRRHLLNSECLKDQFDLIINSLNMSFEEQVRLFNKTTHFVSSESGAHFVNIMFMQPYARVKNILTRTDFRDIDNREEHYDSWQLRFGTYVLIKEFNIESNGLIRVSCSNSAASGDHDFHDHIFIDEKLNQEISVWLYNTKINKLVIQHPGGNHGFFSYCSVCLYKIIQNFVSNKKLPDYVDMSQIFCTFKKDYSDDISYFFFNRNIIKKDILFDNNYNFFTNDLQFTNYHKINYDIINPIINKYFTVSDEIKEIINQIEKKYNINYENTCCIFYRGNDKITETILPSYYEIYQQLINIPNCIQFLLQSDETEFFDFFKSKLDNYIIFNDEIKHIRKQKKSINHVINDYNEKLKLVKNFLAIVIIMSKCKYIICNSGNISIWITYFRGNSNNVYQFLNNEFLIE